MKINMHIHEDAFSVPMKNMKIGVFLGTQNVQNFEKITSTKE